jgi:hypothetical protein
MTPLPLRFVHRTTLLAVLCVLVSWVAGCDVDRAKPLPANESASTRSAASCSDKDGDGFGAGCAKGYDCDDTTADSTNECYRCQTPNEDCPCENAGQTVACGHESSRVGDRVTCVVGERTCTAGKWGACSTESMTTQTLTPEQMDLLAVAVNPTACTNNPCDPFCKHFDLATPPIVDSATTVDATGVTLLPIASGPAGSTCGTASATAPRPEIGMLTMLQRSRNMSGTTLSSVKTALVNFFSATSASGLAVGLDVFPCTASGVGSGNCTSDAPIASPTSNTCRPGTDASMCCGFQYTGPSPSPGYLTAAIRTLPGTANGVRTDLVTKINAVSAVGSGFGADAPMLPALQGGLNAAAQWASSVANSTPYMILVTDGLPDSCGSCGGKKGKTAKNRNACRVQEAVQAAEAAFFGSPSVTTFVIGITSGRGDNLKYLDAIARAGSGGRYGAFIVTDVSNATQTTNALNQIRDAAVPCTFPVPPPGAGNVIDPSTMTVTLAGTGIPRVLSPGACGTGAGYFYDNGAQRLLLCPTTCTAARSDIDAAIQLTYSCRSGCTSGSSQASLGPLDLTFMVDRSSAMATELKDSANNDSGVTAWQATQTTLRNFSRSPDAAGLGVGISYYPPPGDPTAGKPKCLTCKYCADNWGSSDCDCEPCFLPPLASLCWCGSTTDINLKEAVPWPFCPEKRTAGVYGDCVNNATGATANGLSDLSYEYLQGDSASCLTTSYDINAANGGVAYGILPNGSPATTPPHWQNVFNSLGRVLPISAPTSTITSPVNRALPALQSALTQAAAQQTATGRKQAVVLVTSGMPATAISAPTAGHNCGTSSSTVAAAAATGYAAGIPTYVVGVGAGATAGALNPIAQAGQGNASATAFLFNNTADPSAFINAMNQIRRQASSCAFAVPTPPASGVLNYPATEVRLSSGTPSTEQLLTNIANSSTCASTQSWYFDSGATPANLNLCTAPCNTVKTDLNSRVDVVYQCIVPPTYAQGVATFEFDATGACGQDEVPVWGDFSWRATTPTTSKVSFVVATGDRSSSGTITNLSADVPLKFTRAGALLNQTACAGRWTSGGANTCGFTTDTRNIGPQYASSPGDVYVDSSLSQASVARDKNYLRIKATLSPSTDFLSRPIITGWDLQVSCKAAR